MKEIRMILASASPRRRELLRQIGIEPEIWPSNIEETVTSTNPQDVVMELSAKKARDVAVQAPAGTVILGADTVVAVDGQILGKPASHEDAKRMIRLLEGRSHHVYTGVTLIYKEKDTSRGVTFVEATQVSVYPMTREEIEGYAQSDEPMDKAGAYGIQGKFAVYIRGIQGDYGNVVGLPVGRLWQEWKRLMENGEEGQDDQVDCQ